jgi:hypothetical protein
MGQEIEKMQDTAPPLEPPGFLEVEHPRDKAIARMEHEGMQGALGA